MKKLMIVLLMVLVVASVAQAGEFTVTNPMETAAVGFYFPSASGTGDNAIAFGVAHTVLRITHSDIPKLMLDVDGTVAQEVNEEKDTLGGLGLKLGYDAPRPSQTGLMFVPSIGVTALNNFAKFKTVEDIFTNYRVAIYGSAILYKW